MKPMKILRATRSGVALLLLLSAARIASGAGTTIPPPGSSGYGMTVFSGTEPERFKVEIVGTLRGMGSTGDLVLARLSGGPLAQTGVLQGMSGSPVYVDGELIGAVMSTWPFAKEALAGIRPIAEMRAVSAALDSASGEGADQAMSRPFSAPRTATENGLVWSASGFAPSLRAPIEKWLGTALVAAAAGASGPAEENAARSGLDPGDALAVMLVDGDARLFATGTVTARDGDTILAFGHSFLGVGAVSLPMARAEVIALMPSQQVSFKMSAPTQRVGTLLLDRRAGISGRLGQAADMLPVTVRLHHGGGREARQYDFEVGRLRGALANLVSWCVQSALLDRGQIAGEQTLHLDMRIDVEGHDALHSASSMAGSDLAQQLGAELSLPINLLELNPDEPLRLDRVAVDLDLSRGLRVAGIGRVQLSDPEPSAREDLVVRVEILPRHDTPRWRELRLKLPPDLGPGRYRIHVGDGGQAFREEIARSAARWQKLGLRQVREAFALRRPANDLVVILYGVPRSAIVRGVELENLPPSVRGVLSRSHGAPEAAAVAATPLAKAVQTTDWVLQGARYIPIEIPEPTAPTETPSRPPRTTKSSRR